MRVTAETKQATRKSILEVAQKLFAQQGFEPTTTRDIARGARIGVGTLFNYFPTKESIALALVSDAWLRALESLDAAGDDPSAASPSLEEELFAQIAAILRKLKPYRKYLPAALETTLSPAVIEKSNGQSSLRSTHVEMVGQIVSRHGQLELLSPLALQLYWTLFAGVLTFWASDSSPRQEDTLALLDQSLAMFVAWLTEASGSRLPSGPVPAALSSAPDPARLAGPTSANQG